MNEITVAIDKQCGHWVGDTYIYTPYDIRCILENGKTDNAIDKEDGICERIDVNTAIKYLKKRGRIDWETTGYQEVALYLGGVS